MCGNVTQARHGHANCHRAEYHCDRAGHPRCASRLGPDHCGLAVLCEKGRRLVKDPNRVNGGVAGACAGNDGAAVNGATNGERGMNASTGVAELPPGLVALLILSISVPRVTR